MRLLLDTCVWGGAKADLEAAGYDVVWCGEWEQDPGDEEILFKDLRNLVDEMAAAGLIVLTPTAQDDGVD